MLALNSKEAAIEHIANSAKTNNPRDLATQVILIRAARNERERNFTIQVILRNRAEWLEWLTLTQRNWQAKYSRRRNKTPLDTWITREQYVRVVK